VRGLITRVKPPIDLSCLSIYFKQGSRSGQNLAVCRRAYCQFCFPTAFAAPRR
jgi:hypothetical protein